MCIIVAKEKGKELPSKEILRTCFTNNADGAGLMYVDNNGRVVIDKGYMDFKSFYKRINKLKNRLGDLKNKAIVFHFRIGTSGENDKATTHPFPITSDSSLLRKTYLKTDIGMVHNGIISGYTYDKVLSDTQTFIRDFVSVFKELDKKFYKNDRVMRILEKEANSKLCFLDNKENIYYIGDFIEDKGIMYSNSTYKTSRYTYSPVYKSDYDYDYYGYYGNCSYEWSSYDWDDYRKEETIKENNKEYKLEDLSDFLDKKIDYQILNTGDLYEDDLDILQEVGEDETIFIDKNKDLYELVGDKVSLIATDTMVYNNDFSIKQLKWGESLQWNN